MSKRGKILKKVMAFLLSFVILVSSNIIIVNLIKLLYYDQVGEVQSEDKYQSMILQEYAIDRQDNLFVYGSSELNFISDPFVCYHLFPDKKDDFPVFTVGEGGYLPLIHVLNIGALGKKLAGQRVVFIVSPQWFTESGIDFDTFDANYSDEMFYSLMLNPDIDSSIKTRIADRILDVINGDKNHITNDYDLNHVEYMCNLYIRQDMLSRIKYVALIPYFKLLYYIFRIEDSIDSFQLVITNAALARSAPTQNTEIDWNHELQSAENLQKTFSNSNSFMTNVISDDKIASDANRLKNSQANTSYTISPTYEDLTLLFLIFRESGVKPLIVSMPVNGQYYDYIGFDKGKREQYYKKIDEMVSSFGFKFADFSSYEYDPDFTQDSEHLGFKGWVCVDEAIARYCNGN
jgi:D-alanine transfer protein